MTGGTNIKFVQHALVWTCDTKFRLNHLSSQMYGRTKGLTRHPQCAFISCIWCEDGSKLIYKDRLEVECFYKKLVQNPAPTIYC
jgi:hypothetical protein